MTEWAEGQKVAAFWGIGGVGARAAVSHTVDSEGVCVLG